MDPPPKIYVQNVDGSVDRYTAGIELANACRSFYVSRLKAANALKHALGLETTSLIPEVAEKTLVTETVSDDLAQAWLPPAKTSVDRNMAFLRNELVSLVDQDLALMRQLLILNDQIEELKWQRKFNGYSRASLTPSSSWLTGLDSSSQGVLTDTECESPDFAKAELFPSKYPTPSSLSIYDACYDSRTDGLDGSSLTEDETEHAAAPPGVSKTRHRSSTSDLGSSDELVPPESGGSSGYASLKLEHKNYNILSEESAVSRTEESNDENSKSDSVKLQEQVSTDSGFLQEELFLQELIAGL